MYPRKGETLPFSRAPSPMRFGGHLVVQRLVLVVLLSLLGVYTLISTLTTREALAQCTVLSTTPPPLLSIPTCPVCKECTQEVGMDTNIADAEVTQNDVQTPTSPDSVDVQPATTSETPIIGKVMMVYGEMADRETSKLAVKSHQRHAAMHGYAMRVLDRQTNHGLWSKPMYLLRLVLEELAKPESEQIRWLFWSDLDTIVINPEIPLEIFLPPEKDFPDVHVVATNDHNGLNNGAFFIRVSEWSSKYLAAIMALHTFRPDVKLKYSEQSAMEFMTQDDAFREKTIFVPQRWFNAYLGPRDGNGAFRKGSRVPDNSYKPGDVILHFAGSQKTKALMVGYLDKMANNSLGWQMPLEKTNLKLEVARYWKLAKEKKNWDQPVPSKNKT